MFFAAHRLQCPTSLARLSPSSLFGISVASLDSQETLAVYFWPALIKENSMQQVQLTERLYKEAERRASEAGFSSVDEYVADVVSHDLVEENDDRTPNLDHLFTPERLALIDEAAAEIKAGNCFTGEQVRDHFQQKRAAWTRKNPAG
jgi:hypothetical protein